MNLGAIITGDIVDSSNMTAIERDKMLLLLTSIPSTLSPISETKLEIFRGDSFQLKVADLSHSLKLAVTIRALLRSNNFQNSNHQWDARISLGIGSIDYNHGSLGTSDGTAYRLSGHGLDSIGKSRLHVSTPWENVNNELKVSTCFADDIISSWTQSQSKVIFKYFSTNFNHSEIGNSLHISRQMVDKSLKLAKKDLIELYLNRFEFIIKSMS